MIGAFMRRTLAFAIALAICGPALASDTDQFGFGARPISMGGAFTALATDWTGAYYNPAAPAAGRGLTLGGAFSYGHYQLDYSSETPGDDEQDVERQAPASIFTIGIAAPLDEDRSQFLSRIVLGMGLTALMVRVTAQVPMTIRYSLYSPPAMPTVIDLVAMEKGYFAQEGVKIEPVTVQKGPQVIQLLESGDLQAGSAAIAPGRADVV